MICGVPYVFRYIQKVEQRFKHNKLVYDNFIKALAILNDSSQGKEGENNIQTVVKEVRVCGRMCASRPIHVGLPMMIQSQNTIIVAPVVWYGTTRGCL